MKRPLRTYSAGFSMAEILVALALFATVFLALLGLFPANARLVRKGSHVMAATHLAETVMEASLDQGYDRVASRRFSQSLPITSRGSSVTSVYTVDVQVSEVRTGVRRVQVQVWWTDGEAPHSLSMETDVAKLRI